MRVYHLIIPVKAGFSKCNTQKTTPLYLDYAGSYGIQDKIARLFIKRIDGDYYNVVGLPVARLYRELKKIAP